MEDVAELRRSQTDPFLLSAVVPAYEEAERLLRSRVPLKLLEGLAEIAWLNGLWIAGGLSFVLIVGALCLATPLCGDTAQFLLSARMMQDGAVLYADFWDIKQPGIYWFYLLAAQTVGFDQLSIRAFELMVLACFAVLLIAALWRYYGHRWLAAVVPVASVGSYYSAATDWQLTQPEFIVTFPIFCSAWLLGRTYRSLRAARAGWLLSGVLAGVAVVFKLVFAAFFVTFLLIAWFCQCQQKRPTSMRRSFFSLLAPFSAGVAIVLAAVAHYFAAHGALEELLWNSFVFPGLTMQQGQLAPLSRLVSMASWFTRAMAPWLIFAAVGLSRIVRREEPALTKLMGGWLVAGIVVILVQRFSWWPYHTLLLLTPVAVLAIRGIDLALGRIERSVRWRTGPMELALLFVLPGLTAMGHHALDKAEPLLRTVLVGNGDIEAYRREVNPDYARIADDVAAVRSDDPAGPIYVFGSPLYYLHFDRTQAIPMHGWGWEFAVEEQWRALPHQLADGKPAFIYVSREVRPLIERRSPETSAFLSANYTLIKQDAFGSFHRRDAN
jgi:hypothetical protein